MADVHDLLAAFIAADQGPRPADPLFYLAQVRGNDRQELLKRIDVYLSRAPRRRLDAAAQDAAPPAARELADELQRDLFGEEER